MGEWLSSAEGEVDWTHQDRQDGPQEEGRARRGAHELGTRLSRANRRGGVCGVAMRRALGGEDGDAEDWQ